MIGPLFYAIEGNVVARWGTAGLDPVQAMLAASVIGAVMVLPLTLASGQWIDPTKSWGAPEQALILSSVIHAFMYAGYVWLARVAGAVFATQTSYVVTAAGVGWAMLLLGERFSLLIWVAGAVMLLGLALVQPRPRNDQAAVG
jgi:drug/metabolite transporter (DMT)-like permease